MLPFSMTIWSDGFRNLETGDTSFAAVIGSSGLPPGFAGVSRGRASNRRFSLSSWPVRSNDVAHPDGVVNPVSDADVIHVDGHKFAGRDPARVGGGVDFVEDHAPSVKERSAPSTASSTAEEEPPPDRSRRTADGSRTGRPCPSPSRRMGSPDASINARRLSWSLNRETV